MPAILKAASEAGARWAGFVPLRLPSTVAPIFSEWLEANKPDRKDRVLNAIRSFRDGKLNDSNFGSRMRGSGPRADNLRNLFEVFTNKYGLNKEKSKISSKSFRKVTDQMTFEL